MLFIHVLNNTGDRMNLECLRVLNNPEDTMKHKLTQYIYHPHCRAWHVTPDLCMPGGADIYKYILNTREYT